MNKKILNIFVLTITLFLQNITLAASGEPHGEIPWKTIGFQFFNVSVLLFIIVYFGKDKVVALFHDRRKQFELSFEKANSLLEQATRQNLEIKEKLKQIKDSEGETLSRAQAEAKQFLENSKKETDETSQKIMNDVKKLLETEVQKAKNSLVFDAIEETAVLAKNVISKEVDENKNLKIVEKFKDRVEV